MASVKDTVKETLVGSREVPELSHQARSNFLRHAQKDEHGELFMTEDDFINAVAPKHEDYVSIAIGSARQSLSRSLAWKSEHVETSKRHPLG
jgi:hypothetical protein